MAPIVSYGFLRKQCVVDSQFQCDNNDCVLGVLGRQNSDNCLLTDGVAGKGRIRSQNTIAAILGRLKTGSMAIEMWVQPTQSIASTSALFSLGKDATSSTSCANNLVVCCLRHIAHFLH